MPARVASKQVPLYRIGYPSVGKEAPMLEWVRALADLRKIAERIKHMPTVDELKSAIQDALNAQMTKFLDALAKEKDEVKAAVAAALAGSHALTDQDKADVLAMIDNFGTSVVTGVDSIQTADPAPPVLPPTV